MCISYALLSPSSKIPAMAAMLSVPPHHSLDICQWIDNHSAYAPPAESLNPTVRKPHRGWRGYSFDQPPSSFLQQIHLASLAAHVAIRFTREQSNMLSRKDR